MALFAHLDCMDICLWRENQHSHQRAFHLYLHYSWSSRPVSFLRCCGQWGVVMSLEKQSDPWWRRYGPLRFTVAAALIASDFIFDLSWFGIVLGVLIIAGHIWECSPRGKRADIRERLRKLEGKSTEGYTAVSATFLYFIMWFAAFYLGGPDPAGLAKGFVAAWSDVFPKLEDKDSLVAVEFFAWIWVLGFLGIGGLGVVVFWLGHFLGYVEKGDTYYDLFENVHRAIFPRSWTKGFLVEQLLFGPETYAEIKFAATLAGVDDAALRQAGSDLGIKTHKRGQDWIWALPPEA